MKDIKDRNILPGLKKAAGLAEDLLFPPRCPICDEPVPLSGDRICAECAGRIRPIRGNVCRKCGRPVAAAGTLCRDCSERAHSYSAGCAAFLYRDISGSLYRMKFEGRAEYAKYYGYQIARRVRESFDQEEIDAIDALVPVPVSAQRLRQRGYNQAGLLAQAVSEVLKIPARSDVLVRSRKTPGMRALSASERYKNLKNAFIVHGNDVEFMRIMLIDDIYTTGATIDACAEALAGAGAAGIYYAAAAIGEIHDQPEQSHFDDQNVYI